MISGQMRQDSWQSDMRYSARGPILFGFTLIGATVAGFGVWAGTALIAGAIVAHGVFVTTGQNKIVQHLEGGVIHEILVREGDVVERGQTLVELDETAPKAELRRLILHRDRLAAIEARLQAEIDDADEVAFPAYLEETKDDPDVAAIIGGQILTYNARRNSLRSDLAVLQEGIAALNEKIRGARLQLRSVEEQLALIDEELEMKSALFDKGMVRRTEVLALKRARAQGEGEIGRLSGEIGDAHERIARIREEMTSVRNSAIKAAVEKLHENRAEQNDVRERIRAAEDVLNRVTIAAPVEGVIVKLRYHTTGGVIEAGKNVLEIVPLDDELIIEARVRPQDIDLVKRGQHASVRLTALDQRVTPMIEGEVVYVSADALPDERPNEPNPGDNYVARIKLDTTKVAGLKDFSPTPGMPCEVYIKTTDRTFFEYLMRPLRDSMTRAFRET